jgi:hypothetical protein
MSTVDRASMMAQLRANRERIAKDRTKTLKLPGWESLSVRYKRLPWDQIKGLAGMGEGDGTEDIGAAMDVLIAACEEVLFDGDGLTLRYEQKLAELIGDSAVTPPEVIDAVFPDEVSLMVHAGEYMTWAMRLEGEASDELGKDSAGTGE